MAKERGGKLCRQGGAGCRRWREAVAEHLPFMGKLSQAGDGCPFKRVPHTPAMGGWVGG